eukprot:15430503-Alexandrium_andersonii.AAC.1
MRRPYGPGKIAKTSCENACLESVDGVVVCAVSVWGAALRAGAGRLRFVRPTSSRVSRSRVR